jgi:hypothetical protein
VPYCSSAIWASSEICAAAGVSAPDTIEADNAPTPMTALAKAA